MDSRWKYTHFNENDDDRWLAFSQFLGNDWFCQQKLNIINKSLENLKDYAIYSLHG